MQLFLFLILLMAFFYFFKIEKDETGQIKILPRETRASRSSFRLQGKEKLEEFFKSKKILNILAALFVLIELVIFAEIIAPAETLIKVRASQLIPQKFNPIARFAANMD